MQQIKFHNMSKTSITVLMSLLFGLSLSAQRSYQSWEWYSGPKEDKWYYGFTAGVTKSSINEIQSMLIRPIFPEDTYETKVQDILGYTVGAFVFHRFDDSKFAIQPEINFSREGGNFNYKDIEDLQYDIDFNYTYVQLNPMVKYYMIQGIYAAFGPQLSLIIDRSDLTYTSNMPDVGPDLQIQQSLREVLKGNSNVGLVVAGGFDTEFGLNINFKYILGVSDVIETQANGFYFIENKNLANSMHLTIGYHIPFFRD